jgi:hypothetical protein
VFTKQNNGQYKNQYGSVEIDKHSKNTDGTYKFQNNINNTLFYQKDTSSIVQVNVNTGILQVNNLTYSMHNLVPTSYPNVPYTGSIHEPLLPQGGYLTCVAGSILVNRSRFFDGILSATNPPTVQRLYSKKQKKFVNVFLHELLHCFGFHTRFSHFQFGYQNVTSAGTSKVGKSTFHGKHSKQQNDNQPVPMQTRNHFHFQKISSKDICKEIMGPESQNCMKVTPQTKAMFKDCGWDVNEEQTVNEFRQSSN